MSKLTSTLILLGLSFFLMELHAQEPDRLGLYEEGKNAYARGDYRLARELFSQNLERLRVDSPLDTFKVIKSLTKLADSYRKIRLFTPALKYYEEAMALAESGGEPYEELFLDAANNRAFVFSKMFQPLKAIKSYQSILPLSEKLFGHESADHASIYNSMGIDYYKAGDLFLSTEAFLKALDIYRKTLPPHAEGFNRVYNNLGGNYRKTGDLQKSLEYAEKALEIKSKNYSPDHPSMAKYHMNIGKVYAAMNEPEKALPYMEKQLQIQLLHFPENHPNVAGAKGELANIQADLGLYEEALKNNWATLKIDTQYMDSDHPYVLAMYANVALIYLEMGQFDKAEEVHAVALSRLTQRNYVPPHKLAEMLDLQADILLAKGDRIGALIMVISGLRELTPEFRAQDDFDIPNPDEVGDVYTYLRLVKSCARIHEEIYQSDTTDTIQLKEAVIKSENALAAIQKLRAGYHSNEARLFLNKSANEVFKRAVRTSFQYYLISKDVNHLVKSFEMSELAKSDLLKKIANEGLALKTSGVPESLVEELDVLKFEIGNLTDRIQDHKLTDVDLTGIDSLTNLKFTKEEAYNALIRQLEKDYPKYHRMKFESPMLDHKKLNNKLRSMGGGLISYFYDDRSVYIFYTDGQQIHGARTDHLGDLISNINELRSHLTPASALSADSSEWKNLSNMCVKLYDQLILPIIKYIEPESVDRLIISPYGVLHYLSFDILHKREFSGDVRDLDYLILDYPLSYISSIDLWINNITTERTYKTTFTGFAPSYNGVGQETRTGLTNLNWNVAEVRTLHSLVGGNAFFGLDAKKAEFKDLASDSKILHLAMHALADDIMPMRSGLVFSDSDSGGDGYMNLQEIYNMPINSEMIVLNACNTGYGKVAEGEGVLSIAHAFSYSGAQSLLMNLWLADDQAASNIMTEIYSQLYTGHSKDEAVRIAKLRYLSNTDILRSHPYFWAGMTVQGKANAVSFESGSHDIYYYLIVGIIIVGLLLLLMRIAPQKISRRITAL